MLYTEGLKEKVSVEKVSVTSKGISFYGILRDALLFGCETKAS